MKRFLKDILSPLNTPLALVIISFLVYLFFAKDITGDLGKIGQIVFSKEYHSQSIFEEDIDKQLYWCSNDELKDYGVAFLGDSFTKGVYPYYLRKKLNENCAKYFASNIESPEQTFVALCNSNIKMPHLVVLESVERCFVERLECLDFGETKHPVALIYKANKGKRTDFSTFYKNQLINNGAVKHLILREKLFSCPKKDRDLYFFHEDLRFPDERQIETAIAKLDTLFLFAKEHGVTLFYVVAADKYDVYQEFVIDNVYPEKRLLECFEKFEGNPYFVNTKTILLKNAKQGITDLYYADDTHWSPVGAKIVADEITRRMDSLGILRN